MDAASKTQIVERIKQANNILVTVSANPSVDQLAACIGLTLLLNKMQKHATAVFSGQVPSTLEFLQPEKTIETNTDSLRDFIISLDKEKADKLRYKVEDQVVRIFITPYKTSLSEKDLVFSQGDFNVEVVIALGIKDRSQIDAAITAHGRILHDATVISLNASSGGAPELGQINWQDASASSLSEMLVSISETLGPGLIDNQTATAFLTGIVAETDRFANKKTSPRVMTIGAQLMAAGANQQLIVSKLEPEVQTPVKQYRPAAKPVAAPVAAAPQASLDDGALRIDHGGKKAAEPKTVVKTVRQIEPDEIHIDEKGNLSTAASLAASTIEETQPPEPVVPPSSEPPPKPPTPPPATPPPSTPTPPPASSPKITPEPSPPNAPHAFLNPLSAPPIINSTFTANAEPEWANPYSTMPIDPLSGGPAQPQFLEHQNKLTPTPDTARNAVEKAYEAAPFDPATAPPEQALGSQPVDLDKPETKEIVNKAPQPQTAPPPFPPPLTPTQGVVIPTPPSSS